uniref:Putative prolyl 4-hydroxylase 12 isoform X1 n=1 Tax=Rhizophora mucronata TaxID=61149 RepID=A0A2P2L8G9_RHIMU
MASLVFILFFAALTVSQFSNCFADSRKGLRNNQVNRETIVQVARVIPPNRIDPSRVVQLSWRPRSGTFIKLLLILHFSSSFCMKTTVVFNAHLSRSLKFFFFFLPKGVLV